METKAPKSTPYGILEEKESRMKEISRREFLKGAAALGGVAIAAPLLDNLWIPTAAAKVLARRAVPVTPEQLKKVLDLALKRGGDYADVFFQATRNNSLLLREDKIHNAQTLITQGVGIRVIKGEKAGYAYSEDLDLESLLEAARTASYIANELTRKVAPVKIRQLRAPNHYSIHTDPQTVAISRKVEMLKHANEIAKAYDKRIHNVDVAFRDTKDVILVLNSDGHYAQEETVLSRMTVSTIAIEGSERSDGYHGGGGRGGMEYYESILTPDKIAKEACRQAIIQLGSSEAPSGEHPVIIGNGWGGVLLHEAVGHGLEADFNRKNTSLFSGKIGQKVASDLVTIVDDGTMKNMRGTLNVDDEGTPTQKTVLIEKGILKGYMCDRHNAMLMKTKSTGNGRRESYKHMPQCRMTNTYMLAGSQTLPDMISSTTKGFYAKSLGGGQVDITNGNFVFEVKEGYLIENGKITKPVKGATLIGNGPDAMTKVEMVGKDFAMDTGMGTCGKGGQSAPVGLGMPSVKISNMTIGGKG